jgi:putative transposase
LVDRNGPVPPSDTKIKTRCWEWIAGRLPTSVLSVLWRYQIDNPPVDVVLVDQERGLPIGGPWLTLAIDVASRSIAGFSVSLENPSSLSVSLALSHALLPKEGWLAERELHALDWPMGGGLLASIHVDNAKELRSEALARRCQEYGIAIT